MFRKTLIWAILFLASSPIFSQSNSDKIEVLIVDGFSNHDWRQTSAVVKTILGESGLFSVSISTSPAEPEDKEWQSWRPDGWVPEKRPIPCPITSHLHQKSEW